MNVIGHQAIRKDLDRRSRQKSGGQPNISLVIKFVEKRHLSADPTLCDVVWVSGYHKSPKFGHAVPPCDGRHLLSQTGNCIALPKCGTNGNK